MEVRAFNETITKRSVFDQVVLTRQMSDDSASERYSDSVEYDEDGIDLHARTQSVCPCFCKMA